MPPESWPAGRTSECRIDCRLNKSVLEGGHGAGLDDGRGIPQVVVQGILQQLQRVDLGHPSKFDQEVNEVSHSCAVLVDRRCGHIAHRPSEAPMLVGVGSVVVQRIRPLYGTGPETGGAYGTQPLCTVRLRQVVTVQSCLLMCRRKFLIIARKPIDTIWKKQRYHRRNRRHLPALYPKPRAQ